MTPTWQTDDGRVRLYLGDCLEVLPTLGVDAIGQVATDPPYSSGGMVRGDRMGNTSDKYQHGDTETRFLAFCGDTRDQRGWREWMASWLRAAACKSMEGATACVFTDWRQLPTLTDAIQIGEWCWRGIAAWDKENAIPQPNSFRAQMEYMVWGTNGPRQCDYSGGSYPCGVFRCKAPRDREHPTQKPLEVMEWVLSVGAGVVCDPFMGTGTTGVASVCLNRPFIGIEKNPHYFNIAVRRIEAELNRAPLFEAKPKIQRTILDEVPA